MANEFVIRISAADSASATINKINAAIARITEPVDKLQKRTGKLGDVGKLNLGKLEKGFAGVANSASKVVDKIVEIIPGLTAIGGAASIAGLSALATKFGNFGFGLNKSSKLLGMNAQDLAAWHVAAKRAGVTAEEFDSSMVASQNAIRGAAFGSDPHAMLMLNKMGVKIQFEKNGLPNYLATQQKVMAALAKIPSVQGQRDAANSTGFGALLPMIQQGTYAADKARAMRKGLVPTPDEIARATAFHQNVNDLEDSVSGLGNSIGSKLIPVLDPLVNGFAKWLDANRVDVAEKITAAVQKFANWISSINWDQVTNKVSALFDAMGGMKGVAIAIAALTFSGPIGSALSLTAALAKLSSVVIPGVVFQMGLLTAASFAAESARQRAFDSVIPAGPNHDQQVADAMAGGAVTPNVDGSQSKDLGGRFFRWVKGMVDGTSNQASVKDVVSRLQGQGWSGNASAGIAANLFAESKFDPGAVGDNGHAYGIGQWHEDRQALFAKWAGHDIHGSSLAEQLKFVDYELRHGDNAAQHAGRALSLIRSAAGAGRIVSQYYERPADVAGEASRRGDLAGAIASSSTADSSSSSGGYQANGSSDHDANVAALRQSAPDGDRDARLASMRSSAPQVNVTVHNALPGTTVEAKTPDGGYLPTKVNYSLRGADGAAP
jgi:Phage tail lysozyme